MMEQSWGKGADKGPEDFFRRLKTWNCMIFERDSEVYNKEFI